MTITTYTIISKPPVTDKKVIVDKPSKPCEPLIENHTLDPATLKKVQDGLDRKEKGEKHADVKVIEVDTGKGTSMPVKTMVARRTVFNGLWRITHLPSRTVYDSVDNILQFCHTHYLEYDYRTPKTLYSTLFDVLKKGMTDDDKTFQKKSDRSKWLLEKVAE